MAKILVIDDDPDMRTMLGNILSSLGHEVFMAADGREGVRQFRVRRTNLVITDLFMPTQEGIETISQLRKEFPELPIIATSGKTGAHTMLSIAQRLGAVATLEKPFFAHQIVSAVDEALKIESKPVEPKAS